jgi:hypothetical protein
VWICGSSGKLALRHAAPKNSGSGGPHEFSSRGVKSGETDLHCDYLRMAFYNKH